MAKRKRKIDLEPVLDATPRLPDSDDRKTVISVKASPNFEAGAVGYGVVIGANPIAGFDYYVSVVATPSRSLGRDLGRLIADYIWERECGGIKNERKTEMTEETYPECPSTVEEEATAFQAVRQRAKDMGFARVNYALDALALIPRRLWGARDADEGNHD